MGFLSDLVDPFGLLSGIGGGPAIDHRNPDVDPQTKQLILDQTKRAARSDADFVEDQVSGVDSRASLATAQANQQGREQSYGGNQSELSGAIQRKAQRAYERDLNDFTNQAKQSAPMRAFAARDKSTRDETTLSQIQSARLANMQAQRDNEEAARNAALSQILGLAGTVGGFMLAGPAGGAAGGAIAGGLGGGEKLGKSSSGSSFGQDERGGRMA